MTNQQGAPEALRLADRLSSNTGHVGGPTMDAAAAELRRLHAEKERLAALVDAQPDAHVQNPAGIEHVAGDVSKNGAESNMAQRPAPSAAAALPEGWVPLVITHEGQYPEEVAYGPQILMDRLGKWLRKYFDHVVASKAQPAPTPQADSQPAPIDMVLHCPACGLQHIDAPEQIDRRLATIDPPAAWAMDPWKNEPHRSHLCHGCGHIWRPADVPTNGVMAVKTTGKADSPIAARAPADSVLEDAARWQEHVGKLDALVAYCPTCCQGFIAQKEMTRDDVLFACGKAVGQSGAKRLREALDLAVDHIDMDALRISHCKDAAVIDAARKQGANHD